MDHDEFRDDAEDRIHPNERRNPRVVNITVDKQGHEFFGELSRGGDILDTTLTGRVLFPIEQRARVGINGGSIFIDGIEYVFVVDRLT